MRAMHTRRATRRSRKRYLMVCESVRARNVINIPLKADAVNPTPLAPRRPAPPAHLRVPLPASRLRSSVTNIVANDALAPGS